MAVHKERAHLHEAIVSVLAQEGLEFELIIVANQCTDTLWAHLLTYKDERIRLFRTSIGQLCFNLNFALNVARAPLVARMDDDDVCLPGRFLKQANAFSENSDLDVLGCSYETVTEDGSLGHIFCPPLDDASIRSRMTIESPIAHPTVMFRRERVLAIGAYAFGHFGEDYDLWLRLRRDPSVTFGNLPDVLLRYRVHADQMTGSKNRRLNAAHILPLYLREFLLERDVRFLFGFLRKAFLASQFWQWIKAALRFVGIRKADGPLLR